MSIRRGVWSSTENGNSKLNEAKQKGPVYLFFSVNASGQFLGVAKMISNVITEQQSQGWVQDGKWKGKFEVEWIYLKDIPNKQFRHILIESNDNKPVTNSRDCQEVPENQGKIMMDIFRNYKLNTSIIDDFDYYLNREKEIRQRKNNRQTNNQESNV